MQQTVPFLLTVVVVTLAVSCGQDDDTASATILLGRFDGWNLESVESNLANELSTAVLAIPDTTLQREDVSREELLERQSSTVAGITGLENCERDDVLFFEAGVSAFGEDGITCEPDGLRHILDPFHEKTYVTDLEVTQLTFRNPANNGESVYTVNTLTPETLVLSQERIYRSDPMIPGFTYDITYRFTAR